MRCTRISPWSPTIELSSAACRDSRSRAGFASGGEHTSKIDPRILLPKRLIIKLKMMGKLAQMIGLAPEGGKLVFGILFVGLLLLLVGFPILGIPLILLAVAIGSFFRDPER